jgi:hypothetical protein
MGAEHLETLKGDRKMQLDPAVITVDIGVYSGRLNPQFELRDEEARALAIALKAARTEPARHAPPQPKLGQFYGFLIRIPTALAKGFGLPEEVMVHYGMITEGAGPRITHWRDRSGLEERLIEQAFSHGHGDVMEKRGVQRTTSQP